MSNDVMLAFLLRWLGYGLVADVSYVPRGLVDSLRNGDYSGLFLFPVVKVCEGEKFMPQLNLNNIEPDLHIQLCEIAKEQGRSVEELVQTILRQALEEKQKPHLATQLINRFSAVGLRDDETIEELKGQEL